ncbi:MAG: penicillin-binding protein 2 [SAR324 cluster bacterium]|uniref:Penicillin-binding protein 2 n=1 Tax=SAR324 cluster bacterium TaxID=2024889 RepID=A0A7X9FPI9_9DELT|nr:penicillin-binding protein 2 [SAR324 cluster bacterium]
MRLFCLQVVNFEQWQEWALKQHFAKVEVASERGPIYDRNAKLLAVSVPAGSIYIRPRQIKDKAEAIKKLSELLGVKPSIVAEKFDNKSPFVWIKRQVPRSLARKVEDWKLPGVGYILEAKRYYPFNQAASSLIGKVGVDGIGLSGVEALYEKKLHEDHLQTRVVRDALGKTLQFASGEKESFELPRGEPLRLTIDADLQQIVDEELERGRQASNAKAAYAVMIDSDTGEILAMSQAPALNLNSASTGTAKELTNKVVETVFEPGSIFKPIVAASAIELGLARPSDMIDCERGKFRFGKHIIKDVHGQGLLSLRDVVVRSSNIGMTKIGVRMGSERLYKSIKLFGFGEPSNLGLPGESRGIFRSDKVLAPVDVATHAFGQGIAVTPLQLVRAIAAIGNGGKLPKLRLLQSDEPFQSKRLISEETASMVRDMMFGVVEDAHGTGKQAAIKGVRVGGKTGTAQKARAGGRGYAPGSYVASFVGFVDATPIGIKQNISLIVSIDEPKTKVIYGGTLAAPVFREIMLKSLKLLATRYELRPPEIVEDALPKKNFTTVSYRPA